MPCYHPITAWYSASKNPSGKRSLVFAPSGGLGTPLAINCGQCIGCRLERARQWSIRCIHEASLHESSSFITLTYDDDRLPEYGFLRRVDLQLFLKRLRKSLVPRRVRFFACGEYGDRTFRPHYHVLLFGWDFISDRTRYKGEGDSTLYTSESLSSLWGHGQCLIGAVTLQSAGYVARYSMKKITGPLAETHYSFVDRRTGELLRRPPEFIQMSLKPGIGKGWLDQFKSDVYPDDFVVHKGKELRVPKFYDKQIPEAELAVYKDRRKKRLLKHRSNNTPARLAVREEVKRAKISTLKRDSL